MRMRQWFLLRVSGLLVLIAGACPALAGSTLSNDPSPLAVCQDTIREASERLSVETRRRFAACVTRGIECLLSDSVEPCCTKGSGPLCERVGAP